MPQGTDTCPVCNGTDYRHMEPCPHCGWHDYPYLGDDPEAAAADRKRRIEKAGEAWFGTPPPLVRDEFDPREKYIETLQSKGAVLAGDCQLIKKGYDIDTGRLPLDPHWRPWILDLDPPKEGLHLNLEADRARALYSQGERQPLFVKLDSPDGNRARIAAILLKSGHQELPVQGHQSGGNDAQAWGFGPNDWVDIPTGSFMMGSPDSEPERSSNERCHEVRVAGFQMMARAVTFDQYDRFCEATGRKKPDDQKWGRADRPVINVSYWDAVAYAEWLSQQTGWRCRLPTEAEWEYACRAGTDTPFWWGATINPDQANYDGNYAYNGGPKGVYRQCTLPVGQFQPNSWGLYQMHGNVWEWCASEYDESYSGLEQRDASGDRQNERPRVLRGGAWNYLPRWLRAASRRRLEPGWCVNFWGFRLARVR